MFYGTRRSAPVHTLPPLSCVQTVIASTLGVATVKYTHSEGGLALTLKGLKSPASVVDTYIYHGSSGSHIGGALQFQGDYKGSIAFVQSLMQINVRPPQEDIDASRPIMALIERRLESECGIVTLSSQVKETCTGVKCPALTPL